jgi:predicted protein tyrosine phosphatase
MPSVVVSPLSLVPDCIRLHGPSHLVSLLSPQHMIETPPGFPSDGHLRLGVDDVAEPWAGVSPPEAVHVSRLLEFARAWDTRAPMLVHCWAGISRSTAAAYIVLCDKLGTGREVEVAQALRERAPFADPNRLIVRLADEALGREGRMIAAIESIGRGALAAEGVPVVLPVLMTPQ